MLIEQPQSIVLGSKLVQTPAYFPSISSVKTQRRPLDYLSVLSALSGVTDKYLVSAFDLLPLKDEPDAKICIDTARDAGSVVLMDSGNYESYWKNAQGSWSQADFHTSLTAFPCDIAFGFDEQAPPDGEDEHVDLVVSRWELDQNRAGLCRIIPIVHGNRNALPELCRKVAQQTGVEFIAVAERRLGDGLIARAQAIKAIRQSLDSLGRYVFLHILGTGNPISMAVFSTEGADTFDGLEWCQMVVDHDSGFLFHLSQADFFIGQTAWSDTDFPFHIKVLAHNLEFYRDWMARLQRANTQKLRMKFCQFNFPSRIYRICAESLGWSEL
jgi:hypothetical protein